MKLFNKSIIISLVLCLSILTGCQKKETPPPNQEVAFNQFINEEFTDNITDSYLSMHYSVISPENYAIEKKDIEVSLGDDYDDDHFEERQADLKEVKEEFNQFNRKYLTDKQQVTYDIIQYQINLSEQGLNDKFKYFDDAFSPMNGLQSQLPTLFSDFIFYTEQDIKDLVTLVNDTSDYVFEALDYTKKQKENGYMMSNTSIDKVVDYCNKILNEGQSSSILTSINNSINSFNGIDDTVKQQYQSQIKDAFTQSFLPAYQNIVTELTNLKGDTNNDMGLVKLENGKEYYEYLFKVRSSTNTPIMDIKKELLDLASTSYSEIQMITMSNPNVYDDYMNRTTKTKYEDFNTMLEDLNEWSKNNFPIIEPVDYNISALPTETANNGVAAYYNISPIDNNQPDNIRVNMTNSQVNDINTFKTVAHEGFPGHMYQNNYVKQNITEPYLQACANFLGYTEGYATYVELESLNCLDIDEDLKKLVTNLEIYQNCMIALLDIGIHYEGWTKAQTKEYLNKVGLNPDAVDSIYNQIQGDSGAFLSYYVGYLQIRQLKDQAKQELGDKFNELQFNTALLENGTVPFTIVKDNIQYYIHNNKVI